MVWRKVFVRRPERGYVDVLVCKCVNVQKRLPIKPKLRYVE